MMHASRIIFYCAFFITALSAFGQCLTPCLAYRLDESSHTITVSPSADSVTTTKDLRNAMAYLGTRKDQDTRWIWKFDPGRYELTLPLYNVGLQNVSVVSDPKNPATLVKAPNFSGNDYIWYTRMCKNISIDGLSFSGKTKFLDNSNPDWGDSGVFFGSCRDIVVNNNKFHDFGNSAVRFTTSEMDPVLGVNSFNSKLTNNYFNNIFQVATTSNDTSGKHGGTADLLVQNNMFENLRGSIKAASRTPGCDNIRYIKNTIRKSDHFGFEIASCSNVEISDNTIQDVKEYPITVYTNVDAAQGFPWGDNTKINNNTITNCKNGIRFSPGAYPDGFTYKPKQLVIDNNRLTNITDTNKNVPAIILASGPVNGASITANILNQIASKNYISVKTGSTDVVQLNNVAEQKPYGPQQVLPVAVSVTTPAAILSTEKNTSATGLLQLVDTEADTKPTAPSDLSARYDGRKSVILKWTDHANNETEQQIWLSTDGTKYDLLAKLGPNITTYTHNIADKPAAAAYYYTVRATNKKVASGFSKVAKVAFPNASSRPGIRQTKATAGQHLNLNSKRALRTGPILQNEALPTAARTVSPARHQRPTRVSDKQLRDFYARLANRRFTTANMRIYL